MLLSGAPTKTTVPFATSGAKNTIPVAASGTPGLASYTTGFPPLTMTPLSAGGIPPAGQDFNGILNAISQAVQYYSAGATFVYDSTFSSAVSGYPKGAVLQNAVGTGLWLNTTDGNTTNPDSSGAGWSSITSGRLLAIRTITATQTYTPTAGTNNCFVRVQGGGGAGGGCGGTGSGQVAAAGGGAAGGTAESYLPVASLSGLTATVGAGGTSAVNSAGTAGGASSIGPLSAGGGAGGTIGTPITTPTGTSLAGGSAGGIGSGGTLRNSQGGYGTYGAQAPTPIGGAGGASVYGGGAVYVSGTSNGAAATSLGSGGGGGSCLSSIGGGAVGGAGKVGVIEIWEFA